MRPINPPIDPLSHKAAIDAMEAQRAAYRRFARNADAQREALGDGDGERAVAAADSLTRDYATLERGAHELRPMLERVSGSAAPEALREVRRRMDDMMREARAAETAILNLTSQLEAWRDAYGRQLAEAGLAPGGDAPAEAAHGERPGADVCGVTRSPYAPSRRGRAGDARPRLLDRRG
jgi:hypothetical protein